LISLADYLIDLNGKNWKALLHDWLYLLPSEFTIWMINKLGDVIVVFKDGSVHFLDLGAGQLSRIGNDGKDFASRLSHGDNSSIWLATTLIDGCRAAGMTLTENQCYSYRIPPFLGGAFAVENIEPSDIAVHYGLLGQLWSNTRSLPSGAKIEGVTIK
jgi:hypothetical protein